jgi:hypothetical protein
LALRGRRRGSLLAEVAMAAVLLTIAMTLSVKVLGWVALERRDAERRQRAVMEAGNVMERLTAYTFDDVTPALAKRITLSDASRQLLPDPELAVTVTAAEPAPGRAAKRIAIELRWRGASGERVAPVRLTSWVERQKGGS